MFAICRLCGKPTRMHESEKPALVSGVIHVECWEGEAATWAADDPRRAVSALARQRIAEGV